MNDRAMRREDLVTWLKRTLERCPGAFAHLGPPLLYELEEEPLDRLAELLTDDAGRFLLISSAPGGAGQDPEGVRLLGTLPWSPRTPVVRVAAD